MIVEAMKLIRALEARVEQLEREVKDLKALNAVTDARPRRRPAAATAAVDNPAPSGPSVDK